MTTRSEVEFASSGIPCRAWHYTPQASNPIIFTGHPCVVMAHGFGMRRQDGVEAFAERFALHGAHVLLFDYRYLGASGGEPRQLISVRQQLDDWHSAIAFARRLPGVDENRIALWGVSMSGGHVIRAAARDRKIKMVISLAPHLDGFALVRHIIRTQGFGQLLCLVYAGVRDAGRILIGRMPYRIPIIGNPGTLASITSPGAMTEIQSIAAPGWRNEYCARANLSIPFYRPGLQAGQVQGTIFLQACTRDSVVSFRAGQEAVQRAGSHAECAVYDADHFDVYDGPIFERVVADQLGFLDRMWLAELRGA